MTKTILLPSWKRYLLLSLAPLMLGASLFRNTVARTSRATLAPTESSCSIASVAVNPESVRDEIELSEDLFELYQIVDRLIRSNNLNPQHWTVEIIRNSQNYAGTPSWCHIEVEEKLFALLNRDRDRIAFVIAHEVAHNTLQHRYIFSQFLQGIQREMAIAARQAKGPRDFARLQQDARQQIKALRHAQEFAADAMAYEYMARAGYDVRDSLQGLRALEYLAPADFSSKTHPSIEMRAHRLQEHMRAVPPAPLLREGRRQFAGSRPLAYRLSADKNSLVIIRRDRDWN